MSISFYKSGNRLSEATVAGGFVFLSGQVPTNTQAGAGEQTADILKQVDHILEQCGSDKGHICEAVIFLPDLADYAAVNEVWDAWVTPGRTPARACVQAALANPDWKVEIKLTALKIS